MLSKLRTGPSPYRKIMILFRAPEVLCVTMAPARPRMVEPLSRDHRFLATVVNTRETGFKIPIVDFNGFLTGSQEQKNETAREILGGFTSSGFVYLSNADIDKSLISSVFSLSKKFFALPAEEKLKLAWETPESNRGYVAPGREKVSTLLDQEEIEKIRVSNPDLKESLEIGKEPSDNYQASTPAGSPLIVSRINGLTFSPNFEAQ